MSEETAISWTDHTFNPWSGCSKVSSGCAHCYAADLPPAMRRFAEWGANGTRVPASGSYWREPMKWARKAAAAGERRRVFCASVADVFEDRADLDPYRERLWALIEATPELDWLLLTKRPERMAAWAESHEWPVNAWAGTSVEDQRAADERIPHILRVPARVRFLSMEPLLGPVDLSKWTQRHAVNQYDDCASWCRRCAAAREGGWLPDAEIGWVIVGGESGRHARPMHPDWVRSIRDQCSAAGVAFFFKQWGEWAPRRRDDGTPFSTIARHNRDRLVATDGTLHCSWVPAGEQAHPMSRVGKHAAGRTLDGRIWDEFPAVDR